MRGRREAIYALEALRGYMPGCEGAKLRNFGMTLGIRDTRKIDALYNLTGTDVREQGRFDDAIGIFPEFIDGYGVLILPTTGRYWHVPYRALVPQGVGEPARRRALHRRRQDFARLGAQHDVLRGRRARAPASRPRSRCSTARPFDRLDIGAVQTGTRSARAPVSGESDAARCRRERRRRCGGQRRHADALVGAGARRDHGVQQLLRIRRDRFGRRPARAAARLQPVPDRHAERGRSTIRTSCSH